MVGCVTGLFLYFFAFGSGGLLLLHLARAGSPWDSGGQPVVFGGSRADDTMPLSVMTYFADVLAVICLRAF